MESIELLEKMNPFWRDMRRRKGVKSIVQPYLVTESEPIFEDKTTGTSSDNEWVTAQINELTDKMEYVNVDNDQDGLKPKSKHNDLYRQIEIPILIKDIPVQTSVEGTWLSDFITDVVYSRIGLSLSIQGQSLGVQSVGGYINLTENGVEEGLKCMLFHLPRGYREKAKWYVQTGFAKQTMKSDEGELPTTIMGKPVEYIPTRVDRHYPPVILADLSCALVSGAYIKVDPQTLAQQLHYGIDVAQPAAMKVGIYLT